MATNATIFKADLQVSDMDRNHYSGHSLTIARHPSETDERMMVRVVAFALNAHEQLAFCRGLSAEGEPALWQKDFANIIEHWIEVGLPDEQRIRKACHQAQIVSVYAYGERTAPQWKETIKNKLTRFDNLKVWYLDSDTTSQLCALVERTMQLQATIEDGELWLSLGEQCVTIKPQLWFHTE